MLKWCYPATADNLTSPLLDAILLDKNLKLRWERIFQEVKEGYVGDYLKWGADFTERQVEIDALEVVYNDLGWRLDSYGKVEVLDYVTE